MDRKKSYLAEECIRLSEGSKITLKPMEKIQSTIPMIFIKVGDSSLSRIQSDVTMMGTLGYQMAV